MTHDEYTKRLEDILREYIVLKTDDGQPYIYSNDQAITAILALNDEAIGEDEKSKAREDKLRQSPPWQRNQLRQELRNTLGESK